MNLSKDAQKVLHMTVEYAREQQYEYVTPEGLLLSMCRQPRFAEAFMDADGDVYQLEEDLERYLEEYLDSVPAGTEPEFSTSCDTAIAYAGQYALNGGQQELDLTHLLHAIWHLQECYASYYMQKQGVVESDLLRGLIPYSAEEEAAKPTTKGQDTGWQAYAPCLNETLMDPNPLIGREEELARTIQILCRKEKNNPLHIGEPGVGKTAITYGLVQRLRNGDVPDPIMGAKVFALDLGGMLAGTQYRGDFEKRFKKVLEAIAAEEKPIIYIDEIHNLSGAGATGEGAFDAANLLKPYLAQGHIRFIGATTFEEYKKYFEKNRSLARRFLNVEIKEPDEAQAVEILKGVKPHYEVYHGVTYAEDVLKYAVEMSAKHIHERYLPDKAIDLIDEAGAYRRLHPLAQGAQTVDKDVIAGVLTGICRVPVETVQAEETDNLATLEERIRAQVFGQDEAIAQVVQAIKFSRAGLLEEDKPLASLLFVGPTGVGKTEVARTLAKELGVKLIRFDMGEYEEKHAVAKLIGAPAGYVGYEEGGLLTEEVRKNPFAVLLLDEIEKAHADIYNVLLSVMDYATLTDNQGRKADFRNVVVIMTSNAGAKNIGRQSIGFTGTAFDKSVIKDEVKRVFQPEFINRLNCVVTFESMNRDMAARIVDKKLSQLSEMLQKKSIRLEVTDGAREKILAHGISKEFGAREIDRVIRNEVKPLFVDAVLFGDLKDGGELVLAVKEDAFAVETKRGEQR